MIRVGRIERQSLWESSRSRLTTFMAGGSSKTSELSSDFLGLGAAVDTLAPPGHIVGQGIADDASPPIQRQSRASGLALLHPRVGVLITGALDFPADQLRDVVAGFRGQPLGPEQQQQPPRQGIPAIIVGGEAAPEYPLSRLRSCNDSVLIASVVLQRLDDLFSVEVLAERLVAGIAGSLAPGRRRGRKKLTSRRVRVCSFLKPVPVHQGCSPPKAIRLSNSALGRLSRSRTVMASAGARRSLRSSSSLDMKRLGARPWVFRPRAAGRPDTVQRGSRFEESARRLSPGQFPRSRTARNPSSSDPRRSSPRSTAAA